MPETSPQRKNEDWLAQLQGEGQIRDRAILDLRDYLLRVILVYLERQRADLSGLDHEELRQLADDWAQQSLLKVLAQLGGFRGQSKLTTWAYRVAINLVASELRRRHWREASLDALLESGAGRLGSAPDGDATSPESSVTRDQIWATVEQSIASDLSERQRVVITRVVLEGIEPELLAAELGTNRNNIYKILHDARRKLKQSMLGRGWTSEEMLAAFSSRPP